MNPQIEQQITLTTGRLVALYLWHLGAVNVNVEKPFRLTSGNYSPIYINCRQLISSVSFMDLFAAASRQLLMQRGVDFNTTSRLELPIMEHTRFQRAEVDAQAV